MNKFYFKNTRKFHEALNWCEINLEDKTWGFNPGRLFPLNLVIIYNHDDAVLFRLTFDAMHC